MLFLLSIFCSPVLEPNLVGDFDDYDGEDDDDIDDDNTGEGGDDIDKDNAGDKKN